MNVVVVVIFRVKQTQVGAFRELMNAVKTNLPTVSGCRGVHVFQGVDDPSLFMLVESWESKEKHRAHVAMLVASGQWARIVEYLAADPVTNYLAEL